MNFSDIFKKSFFEMVTVKDISTSALILTMLITCLLAAYIFFVYRLLTRKTFYNKNFGISLAAITVIVAAIIITIQSSLVVSLGMVGALSIVRFRTAIKEPMDLVFMFWAISIGIICGAGLPGIAIVTSAVLTVGILVLNAIPVAKVPLILIINSSDISKKDEIINIVESNVKSYKIKSQTVDNESFDMIIEVRTKNGDKLISGVSNIEGITRCSLIDHDGEVTF